MLNSVARIVLRVRRFSGSEILNLAFPKVTKNTHTVKIGSRLIHEVFSTNNSYNQLLFNSPDGTLTSPSKMIPSFQRGLLFLSTAFGYVLLYLFW